MAIDLKSLTTGGGSKPPRILFYAVHGIGKTSFAANAPAPVFIQTEDGLGEQSEETRNAARFPIAASYQDVSDALTVLATEKHDFMTVAVDSLDWLEPLILQRVCEHQGVNTIEAIPYGKGFVMALDIWREFTQALNYLRNEKTMLVIETAHADVKRYEAPDQNSYDRYMMKLNPKAAAIVEENADIVLFGNYKTFTKEDANAPGKKGEKRLIAVGNNQRFLYTAERPAFRAKNRYNLPEEIPLDGNVWGVLSEHIGYLKQLT